MVVYLRVFLHNALNFFNGFRASSNYEPSLDKDERQD